MEAFNQSATTANPGNRSPREVFTGKKRPFRMLPFFQHGFMWVQCRQKPDDEAETCYFLNNGDRHADFCVRVLKASTGKVCYVSYVVWSSRSPTKCMVMVRFPRPRPRRLPQLFL